MNKVIWKNRCFCYVESIFRNGPRIRNQRSQKLMYVFFCIFLSDFRSLTSKWPGIWYYGGQRTSDSKSATPKTYVCNFLDFLIEFFAVWLSNDLESDMMKVNRPRIRNQWPQNPIYLFFWIFLLGFLPKTLHRSGKVFIF